MMKYAFFGTPEFAAIILEKLIKAGMPPVLVVCNPDRPMGRKKIITPPPVKTRIMNQELGIRDKIKIIQPEKLEIRNWELEIEKLGGIDFAIVAAYAKIIPKNIIDTLPAKFLGVHPSLLPKYRGATPIQSAILNGEKKTGVTLFLIDEKVDHGQILVNKESRIMNNESSESLHDRLAELGADLLIETLPKFVNGEIKPQTQNEAEATYTKKFETEDAFVDLEKDDPDVVMRKINALNPEPGVYTIRDGKRVKILAAELKDGKLKLTRIQEAGGMAKAV